MIFDHTKKIDKPQTEGLFMKPNDVSDRLIKIVINNVSPYILHKQEEIELLYGLKVLCYLQFLKHT